MFEACRVCVSPGCRQKHEKGYTVCGMAWHPSGSQMAYTDTEGCLGLLDALPGSSANAPMKTNKVAIGCNAYSWLNLKPKSGLW